MLLNYAPWGGLEAYQRVMAMTNYSWVKMGKNVEEFFWTVSMHYLINALVDKEEPSD